MLKIAAVVSFIGLVVLLGACSPTPPAATATPEPPKATSTPATPPTQAPTPTEYIRATLPPTWTPEATEATEAVLPTATSDPRIAALRADPPPPEICGKFGVDAQRNPTVIPIGSPAQIYWTSAKHAMMYEVVVYDVNNAVVSVQRTADTTILLRAGLFSGYDQPYAWLVTPLDANGNPLCIPRGSDFRTASQ